MSRFSAGHADLAVCIDGTRVCDGNASRHAATDGQVCVLFHVV
jgi:hypothetical protein